MSSLRDFYTVRRVINWHISLSKDAIYFSQSSCKISKTEILNLFCQYESLNKQLLVVKEITAIALSDKQQKLLNKKLTAKLACNISLQCSIDKKLLGGIVIKIGDTVIDSSIPKQLMQLLEFVIR